jgi:hypothetical protein
MRSRDELYADLEGDRRSREAEIALFEGLIPRDDGSNRDSLKRSLVLLIYSHVEGYCKFSLLTYVGWLNSAGLKCEQVAYPLVAATLSKVFAALRDPSSKHDFFRNVLPLDSTLHLVAREQAFVERCSEMFIKDVNIPDRVVDTKSNVTPELLMKMLYLLGMNYREVEPHSANLSKLLGIRNAIAHGDRLKVPKDEQIVDFRTTAGAVMSFLQDEVYSAIRGERYLRGAN